MKSIMLIDDHPMINHGLASCLEETGLYNIYGQAISLDESKDVIENKEELPSLIILDIMLGEENGLDFLGFLDNYCKEKNVNKPPVLICSVFDDPFRIRTALKLGASGYITKTSSRQELLGAIDTLLSGQIYVSESHSEVMEASSDLYFQLTRREMEILNLVKLNKSNQEIAKLLKISLRTIENHLSNIYFKTGIENRLGLLKL